jgi:hypothetical protein
LIGVLVLDGTICSAIEKWDGTFPQMMAESGALLLINVDWAIEF